LSELTALHQLNSEAAFGAAFFISYANCFLKFWDHEAALSQILCIERPSTDRLTKGSNRYTRTGSKGVPVQAVKFYFYPKRPSTVEKLLSNFLYSRVVNSFSRPLQAGIFAWSVNVMKKIGILLFLAALIIGVAISGAFSFGPGPRDIFDLASLFKGEVGSGHIETSKRDVADFNKLKVGGVFDVEVSRGDKYSVEVIADDNLLPFIRTEVDGDTLSIYSDAKISKSSQLRVVITAPDIRKVKATGASKVLLKDVSNEELALNASGASKITASGSTALLTIDVSGASKVLGSDLASKQATVETSGASSADIKVSDSLNAHASGASHIRYVGSPGTLDVDRSGAGTVSQQTSN